MSDAFDKDYWQQHWRRVEGDDSRTARPAPPNPYVARETGDLVPGTALDAGCGEGAEAMWLASRGWRVTAADISPEALARAAAREAATSEAQRVRWVEADLTTWDPGRPFDLVTTHYAHPAMPQLDFYRRVSAWVAPGGTLLIVGHLHEVDAGGDATARPGHGHGHGDHPPAQASVTVAGITAVMDAAWEVVTAAEHVRTVPGPEGGTRSLRDVVVRATRRA